MPRRPTPRGPALTGADAPLAVIQEALRRKAEPQDVRRIRLRHFVPGAWPVVEGRRPFLPNWHIDAVSDCLEAVGAGQLRKLVINEPPGMAKSLVASVMFPAWQWGPNGKPETRFLCVSYGGDTASPANRDAERCRDLLVSDWYQREWGTEFRLSDVQNAKSFFANDRKGYRVSTGLDGGPSGQRADIVLIDDPTKLDADGLAEITHPAEVYERTLLHRAIDEGSAFVLIMQRLHPDDLAGYFLKQDGWELLRLPMFYEADRKSRVTVGGRVVAEDPRTQEGEPLHAGMTTAVEKARSQARTRPDIYLGQQQQRPTAAAGQVVTRIDRFDALPDHFDEIIVTVDCAFKAEKDNSFVVFQKWARRHADAYLLDQHRDHMELPATIDALAAFCARAPLAAAKYVEAKANGIGVVQMLGNRVPGLMTTDEDPVLKAFCAGSKEAKVQAAAPYFRAGNVKIPSGAWLAARGLADWTPEYVQELKDFPKSRYNDQADASAMGVWRLLHTFEAHVSAAETMAVDAGNVGLVADVFDKAYADVERVGLAFGAGRGVTDMAKEAYGR